MVAHFSRSLRVPVMIGVISWAISLPMLGGIPCSLYLSLVPVSDEAMPLARIPRLSAVPGFTGNLAVCPYARFEERMKGAEIHQHTMANGILYFTVRDKAGRFVPFSEGPAQDATPFAEFDLSDEILDLSITISGVASHGAVTSRGATGYQIGDYRYDLSYTVVPSETEEDQLDFFRVEFQSQATETRGRVLRRTITTETKRVSIVFDRKGLRSAELSVATNPQKEAGPPPNTTVWEFNSIANLKSIKAYLPSPLADDAPEVLKRLRHFCQRRPLNVDLASEVYWPLQTEIFGRRMFFAGALKHTAVNNILHAVQTQSPLDPITLFH